jgi:aryl-phospho-beta-D-glucosidase BglC (GH1 family)
MKSEKSVKFENPLLFAALFAVLVSMSIGTASAGTVYQDFEGPDECGWGGNNTTDHKSVAGEPVHSGNRSFRANSSQYWNYFFVRSKDGGWHTDLIQEYNNRLTFWIYALPEGRGAWTDNTVAVKFYDHDNYSSRNFSIDAEFENDLTNGIISGKLKDIFETEGFSLSGKATVTKEDDKWVITDREKDYMVKKEDGTLNIYSCGFEVWTTYPTHYGKWTKLPILFDRLPPDLNLSDIDKLEFKNRWPGTYYLDKIEATSSVIWDRRSLKDGILKWESIFWLNQYRLEENILEDPNDWTTVYVGPNTTYTIPHISKVRYRVRAEEVVADPDTEVPFISAWSEVLEYNAPAVVINKSKLMEEQKLEWTNLAHATSYEVQCANCSKGPWEPCSAEKRTASENTWYQVRALNDTEKTDWSPPQWKPNPIEQDFLRAHGTKIRKGNGVGDIVTLRGVNLGGYFIIEPWMNDWSSEDLNDDYSIRKVLDIRGKEDESFGPAGRDALLQTYRDAFLTEVDFDILMRMGVSLVRLPIYYRDLQDDNGSLIPGCFEKIDWVVNTCADRGMYVLLDLHGAPGSQSKKDHTGRECFNKLFEESSDGKKYQNHTVELWKAIATYYKNSTTVMGYDLLNEPIGAFRDNDTNKSAGLNRLWKFYNRTYDAIRAIDSNHIIVMEGIWDCNTLPNPTIYKWENVVYQFHYYLPEEMKDPNYVENVHKGNLTSYIQAHEDFIDEEIRKANTSQNEYRIPFMVGEFNGFRALENWDYYLENFSEQGWSWTLWSYKVSRPNSNWGLLTNHHYDEDDLPQFRNDIYDNLSQKLTQYDTLSHYVSNSRIIAIVENYLIGSPTANAGPDQHVEGSRVSLNGSGSSDADGDKLTYHWSLTSKPKGSSATLSDPQAVSPSFIADIVGEYVAELVVNDSKEDNKPDSVTITVEHNSNIEKLVVAAYQPYWGNETNWRNWAYTSPSLDHPERNVDPSNITSDTGRRDIASVYYPAIEVYDSGDRDVLSYHVDLAQAMGIDVLQVDYYADLDSDLRSNFEAMLEVAQEKNFLISVLYEPKIHLLQRWISHDTKQEKMEAIISDICNILERYGDSPVFLHHDNKPVVSIFGIKWGELTASDWSYIVEEVRGEGYDPLIVGDNSWESDQYDAMSGMFHWELYKDELADANASEALSFCTLINDLTIGWASQKQGRVSVGIVFPGFNDAKVWGWDLGVQRIINITGPTFYEQSLNTILNKKDSFDWVLIATFNDWNEGTIIEPHTDEDPPYTRAIMTQNFVEEYKGISPLDDNLIERLTEEYKKRGGIALEAN